MRARPSRSLSRCTILAVLRHPEAFNRWTRTYSRMFVPRVVRAAQRVIAVSEFTKRELDRSARRRGGRDPRRAERCRRPVRRRRCRARRAITCSRSERSSRARTCRDSRGRLSSRVWSCASPAHWGWGDRDVLNGDGVRVLGFVDDDELARLYRGALCVAYTSLYEGFGIPVLEALACGAPVVTSAGTAMEEVADGAAVLVDPLDPDSIVAGIREAIGRRDELAALGPERARRFSWRASAEATAAVYREVA